MPSTTMTTVTQIARPTKITDPRLLAVGDVIFWKGGEQDVIAVPEWGKNGMPMGWQTIKVKSRNEHGNVNLIDWYDLTNFCLVMR